MYFGQSLLELEAQEGIHQQDILEQIKKLGFRAEFLNDKAAVFEGNKKQNREHLSKLGVAGFCAGNIMLSTIPIYTGVEKEYHIYFASLSFVLFLPIVIYCAQDFYRNALRSLKSKSLNIDLPISIALLAGFIFSTWNLINKNFEYIYYDSTASFIFLIISARYLLARLQQNFVATYSDADFGLNDFYQIADSNIRKKKEDIKPNDKIVILEGQAIPIRSRIISDYSEWNLSLITGEGYPQSYHKNLIVQGGAILVSKSCNVEALETYDESHIYKFQNKLNEIRKTKSEMIHFTDKFSNYFIVTVFLIAILFFAYYSSINVMDAFQRSLALIIVACPCALALGTPLAYLLGVYRAKEKGILIFKKDIFDRILEIKNVFFDKTGTLTQGILSVKSIVPENTYFINVLLNLEFSSQHPIAYALRKKFGKYYFDLGNQAKELPGIGVMSEINGKSYRFLKNIGASSISSVLYEDNEPVMQVQFEDATRSDSSSEIVKLKKYFNNLYLLTGDSEKVAEGVALDCNIENVFFDKTPEMKKEIIDNYQPALMVGDGLNDTLALQASHVGIAVQGSVQLSADSSDAYLLNSGVGQISILFKLAKSVHSTIYTNLGISLLYNLIAGYFSLTGDINPLIAAVLMPISSIAIILNTLRGVR